MFQIEIPSTDNCVKAAAKTGNVPNLTLPNCFVFGFELFADKATILMLKSIFYYCEYKMSFDLDSLSLLVLIVKLCEQYRCLLLLVISYI